MAGVDDAPDALHDELETLRTIVMSLNASLSYYVKGVGDASFAGGEVVDPRAASEFVSLIPEIVTSQPEGIQRLLFDAAYDTIGTLTALAASSKRYAPTSRDGAAASAEEAQQAFSQLREASIATLKELVEACSVSDHLLKLCASNLSRAGFVDTLVSILVTPSSPAAVRQSSMEALFVAVMRCGVGVVPASAVMHLVNLAPIEPTEGIRNYATAVIFEVSAKQPRLISDALTTLLKLVSVDRSPDVRCLCLGAVANIVRWRIAHAVEANAKPSISSDELATICETVDARLESRVEADDVLEAASRLFEQALLASCALRSDFVFRHAQQRGTEQCLLRCLERPIAVASIAARALRVLVERSPPALCVANRLLAATCLGTLLKQFTDAAQDVIHAQLPVRVLAVELALILGLCLLVSPKNRLKFTHELAAFPRWSLSLASSVQEVLGCVAIDYFTGMVILDEASIVMNDVDAVVWGDSGALQPDQASLRMLLDAQAMRRQPPGGISAWIDCEDERERSWNAPVPKRDYLASVLVGFVVIATVTDATRRQTPPPANEAPPDFSVAHGSPFRSPRLAAEHDANATDVFVNNTTAGVSVINQSAAMDGSAFSPRSPLHIDPSHVPSFPTPPPGVFVPHQRTTLADVQSPPRMGSAPLAADRDASMRGPGADGPDVGLLRLEFQSCMELAMSYAELYRSKRDERLRQRGKKGNYTSAGNGLMMKAGGRSGNSKLSNPFAPADVDIQSNMHLRAWTVGCVEEGDLFFFSIPLPALTATVVEVVIAKARKHATLIRKACLMTPTQLRERRWFLHDMQNAIMPRIVTALKQLHMLVSANGEQHVQMALAVLPAMRDAQGDGKSLHCGNLVRTLAYLTQYFGKATAAQQQGSLAEEQAYHRDMNSVAAPVGYHMKGSRVSVGAAYSPPVRAMTTVSPPFPEVSPRSPTHGGGDSSGDDDFEDRY